MLALLSEARIESAAEGRWVIKECIDAGEGVNEVSEPG